jgi:hypothetical protein
MAEAIATAAPPQPTLTRPTPGMAFPAPSGGSPTPTKNDGGGGDPWGDLDDAIKPTAPELKPAAAKPPEPAKPTEPIVPRGTTPAKPVAAPAKSAIDDDARLAPSQLREAKKRAEDTARTAQARVTELEARMAAAEAKGLDNDTLSRRLAAVEKERDEAVKDLRIARYEPNDGVKAARKALNQAGATAKRIITSLTVTNADGSTAQADWGQFMTLATTLEPGPALKAIRERFGEDAQLAIQQYFEITKHTDALDSAEQEDRAGFNERVTKETATKTQQREGFAKMVNQVRSDMQSKNPEFAPSPDDPEADAIFKKGMGLAKMATSEQFHSLSPTEQAVVVANIEARAGAFPRLLFKFNRLQAKFDAMKAENDELRGGTLPPEQRPGGSEAPATEPAFDADFDEAAKVFGTA